MKNSKIIPISQARSQLGTLVNEAKGSNFLLLTKGGKPTAALVDIDYLEKLQQDVDKLFQKTYIDPKLLPLTRTFTSEEVEEWQKEDAL